MPKIHKIAVILEEGEPLSKIGGAFSTITAELFSRLTDYQVVAFSRYVRKQERLSLRNITVKFLYSGLLPFKKKFWFVYRSFYLIELILRIDSSSNFIFIMNRPGYVRFIRPFFKRAKIIVFMGNRHFISGKRRNSELAIAQADLILGSSQYICDDIIGVFPQAKIKTKCLYNGVDTKRFSPGENFRRADTAQHKITILFVGRLCADKGVHVLISAYKELTKRFQNIELVIVGSSWFGVEEKDDYIRSLEELSKECADKIRFTGFVLNEEIHKYYQQADIFVAPSTCNEAFGLMNLEAMSCGLPVVTTNKGGIPEVVGDAGVLVPAEEPMVLADAIKRLIADRHYRLHLGSLARDRTERFFSWERVSGQLGEILKELINNN